MNKMARLMHTFGDGSWSNAMKDCELFERWEEGEFDTKYCIRRWKQNNHIDYRGVITEREFTMWLQELGYNGGEY